MLALILLGLLKLIGLVAGVSIRWLVNLLHLCKSLVIMAEVRGTSRRVRLQPLWSINLPEED